MGGPLSSSPFLWSIKNINGANDPVEKKDMTA